MGDAGGQRRSSEKVRVATPGTENGDDDDRRQNGADRAVEKEADGDLVREMLAFAAGRIMESEVEARTGAAKGAR